MLASIPAELTLIYAMLYDPALTRQPSYILCDTARILRFLLTVLLLLLLSTLLPLLLLSLLCAMMLDWCACGTEQMVSIGCGAIPVRLRRGERPAGIDVVMAQGGGLFIDVGGAMGGCSLSCPLHRQDMTVAEGRLLVMQPGGSRGRLCGWSAVGGAAV